MEAQPPRTSQLGRASAMATKWFSGAPFGVQSNRWGRAGAWREERTAEEGLEPGKGRSYRRGGGGGGGLAVRDEGLDFVSPSHLLHFPAHSPCTTFLKLF